MKVFTTLLAPIPLGLAAADTLSIDLHANSCQDAAFQSFTIGNINECHNANQKFNVYVQHNIAQSFFGRNLGIRAFADPNCGGPSSTNSLSNARSCVGGAGLSFMLVNM
jgi:hypothetical protein